MRDQDGKFSLVGIGQIFFDRVLHANGTSEISPSLE